MSTPTETFDPGPRYRIVRRVGQGGMGVVYEATDLQYSRRIAIKTLKHSDPQLLFFLKQEFRALADVRHPNLIALYELFAEGDQCFFTMEYVDGVDLLRYVRGYAGDDDDTAERVEFTETMAARTVNPMAHAANPIRAPWQLHRLRDTVGQIGEGLDTIHRARKLHRDLKPSNILVTPEGRTVILDFGLMSGTTSYSPGAPVAGTLAYMSPEQSLGEQLTPASDWYSVGTIVYEALTGVLPF